MKKRGLRGHLQIGMVTGFKNGVIASLSCPADINHLTPFYCAAESNETELSSQTLLKLTEQSQQVKLRTEDIDMITSCSTYLPYNFYNFLHQLRNMRFLCEFLGGETCMSTIAWDKTVQHAKRNEETYIGLAEDNGLFYISLLNDYHYRFQNFLHSCSFGKVLELDLKQLDFSALHDRIELREYNTRQPRWMTKRSTPSTPTKKRGGSKRQRPDVESSRVPNPDKDDLLRVPAPLRFRGIFHPMNRSGIPAVNHSDGTVKCNNFHHRGHCFSSCKYKASHNKPLSQKEREDNRKYVLDLIHKYNANQGMPPRPPTPTRSTPLVQANNKCT